MKVERFVNNIFASNSYILYSNNNESAFVIDPGDSIPIIDWSVNNDKIIIGIFLTHSHFDHIYGINDLQEKFPNIIIYASPYAKDGMMSNKLNGSLYMEMPFVVKSQHVNFIKEGDKIQLWDSIYLNVIESPGHDRDCLSFQIERNLFTGDALIPGVKVVAKRKYGDKNQAKSSIERIFKEYKEDTIIWPGHKDSCLLKDLQ